jgi:hypothetical protein
LVAESIKFREQNPPGPLAGEAGLMEVDNEE